MYRDNHSIAFGWQYFVRPMGMNLFAYIRNRDQHWACRQIVAAVIYLYSGNRHAWIDILLRAKRPNRLVHCSIAMSERVRKPKLHETGKLCCHLEVGALTTVAIRRAESNPCNCPNATMLRFSLCTSSINCLLASVKCNSPPAMPSKPFAFAVHARPYRWQKWKQKIC